MYQYIYDPKTQEKITIFSKKGRKIIDKYEKTYFKKKNNLTKKKKKFCRCVLHVAKKNTEECNRNKIWTNKCYNPYTVCAKSVKTTTGGKPCFYDFNSLSIPDDEILAYYYLNSKDFDSWRNKIGLKSKDIKELRLHLNQWYNLYKIN